MDFYTNVAVQGDMILFRGVRNNKRVRQKLLYKPTLYLRDAERSGDFFSLQKDPLKQFQPGTIKECKDFIEKYKDTAGFNIYGLPKFDVSFISDEFPGEIQWDINQLLIVNIDIEVGPAEGGGYALPENPTGEITSITLEMNGVYHIFSSVEYTPADDEVYHRSGEELGLFLEFLNFWMDHYPDVIVGYNSEFYDLPYIVNRMKRILGEEKTLLLSPWKKITDRQITIMGRSYTVLNILGIASIDYMNAFKKFHPEGAKQESYKLDDIAFNELGIKKISYEEYDNLFELYKNDPQKFIQYNRRDVEILKKLEEKNKLIFLILTMAYDAKVNIQDVFFQTRMWTSIIYNYLIQKKTVILYDRPEEDKDEEYVGAFVRDPLVGLHYWVVSFDLTGLYPSIMQGSNVSPEKLRGMHQRYEIADLIEKKIDLSFLRKDNITYCANGALFEKDGTGFLGDILEKMAKERKVAKNKMIEYQKQKELEIDPIKRKELEILATQYDTIQQAKKICANSCYGALGNSFFFMYDTRLAEAITLTGQLAINWIMVKVNEYMNSLLGTKDFDYIIAGDTDSLYLNLGPLINKILPDQSDKKKIIRKMEKLCIEKIQVFIDTSYDELKEYLNAPRQKFIMKLEVLADKGIWMAKKNYCLNSWYKEGVFYDKPKLKVVGHGQVKSSLPKLCRTKLKEATEIILNKTEDDLLDYIAKFKEDFKVIPIEDITKPSGVNGIKKYDHAEKGIPVHVMGSLIYNEELKKQGLDKKYLRIMDGDKVKWVYLKEPNPFHSHVIAFPHRIPKEFEIDKWIDRDQMYEKVFLEPLKIITDAIGWKTERMNTLW